MVRFAVAVLGALIALPAMAQGMTAETPATCTGTPPALPAELSGWAMRVPVTAAADASGVAAAALTLGKGADVVLLKTPAVTYPIAPKHPGDANTSGGLVSFTIGAAATYRVALGAAAWIDVLQGDKAIFSTAHTRGPDCSGIRKMVDFPLTPGRYVLAIAGNDAAKLPVLVTRLP